MVIGPNSSVREISSLAPDVLDDRRRDEEALAVRAAGQPFSTGKHGSARRSCPLDATRACCSSALR